MIQLGVLLKTAGQQLPKTLSHQKALIQVIVTISGSLSLA